jgi:hypothetical protein
MRVGGEGLDEPTRKEPVLQVERAESAPACFSCRRRSLRASRASQLPGEASVLPFGLPALSGGGTKLKSREGTARYAGQLFVDNGGVGPAEGMGMDMGAELAPSMRGGGGAGVVPVRAAVETNPAIGKGW